MNFGEINFMKYIIEFGEYSFAPLEIEKYTVPTRIVSSIKKIVLKTCLYFFADISVKNKSRMFFEQWLKSLLNFASDELYLIYS